jgi:hypothetical protein
MKRTLFVCSLILAMAMAVAVTAAAPGDQNGKTVPRQISGVMDGRFTFDVWGPGWFDFTTFGDATGTLKHLGLAQMYTKHTPNPDGDGTLVDTEFTIVAANGDKIWGTYSDGLVTEAGVEAPLHYYDGKATFVITGGTGRFSGATGTINATFFETVNYDTWACSVAWALDGTIRY